ncbi:hypothetical protein H0A71_06060 [Alcaligenaceae bacterium]|nr:hypothetical protein [Alcaligenaceae bacterium]
MTTVKQHKRSYANYLGSLGGTPEEPKNTVAPSITGTAQVGGTLTSNGGTWTGRPTPNLSRVWSAGGVVIVGATGLTYDPIVGDIGKTITVSVTGYSHEGRVTVTSIATTAVIGAE